MRGCLWTKGVAVWGVVLLTACAWVGSARGQVEMDLALEHQSYVVNEPVLARLRVRNVSDIPLVFGGEYSNVQLSLRVRRASTADEDHVAEVPLVRDLVVMPDDTEVLLVEFSSQFKMVETGMYRISVGVEIAGKRYRTKETLIDMVTGVELKHVRRPVSGYLDVSFDYSLRYWTRDGAEYLFLSVSNPDEGLLYGTFMLGRLLRVHPPRIDFLPAGVVKVVHQSAAERLTVSTFDVDRVGVSLRGQEHFRPDGSRVKE